MTARDIPNALSALRILMIVPLVWALWHGHYAYAAGLFFVAGFTDGLDGFLARRFDWRSPLGAVLDPVADKLMTLSTFATLAVVGLTPWWLAALVIGRDVVIVGGALVYRWLIGGFQGGATAASKINTLSVLMYVFFVLTHAAFSVPGEALVLAAGALLMVTAVVSGLHYIWVWSRRAAAAGHPSSARGTQTK